MNHELLCESDVDKLQTEWFGSHEFVCDEIALAGCKHYVEKGVFEKECHYCGDSNNKEHADNA